MQLVAGWNPLGHKDVPLVRIQTQYSHLDLLLKVLSQQHIHPELVARLHAGSACGGSLDLPHGPSHFRREHPDSRRAFF
jgi:hypothetical protein